MIQHKTSGSQTDSDQILNQRRHMTMGQDHLEEPCLDDFH